MTPLVSRDLFPSLLWTSEEPAAEDVRAEVLASCFRAGYLRGRCAPKKPGEMMEQEGGAARFAGRRTPRLSDEDLACSREVISFFRGSNVYADCFSVLYGDTAARAIGLPPLGLSTRAGLAVAVDDAWRSSVDVVAITPG